MSTFPREAWNAQLTGELVIVSATVIVLDPTETIVKDSVVKVSVSLNINSILSPTPNHPIPPSFEGPP